MNYNFSTWLEGKQSRDPRPDLPPTSMMSQQQLAQEWERLKREWDSIKKRGPRLFVPLFEKMKNIQQKYQELTGQLLDPDFKYW
jgi:uncharacterized protein YaaR (DUF327 family)